MAKVKIGKGKLAGLQKVADDRGIIRAAAMDQRGSLKKSIAKARGSEASSADMAAFKSVVTEVLTPHASAILLDPEFGLEAMNKRSPNAGVLLAYEKSGYDNTQPGRLPDLLDHWSVKRLADAGADAVKILLYYTPFEQKAVNEAKHAWVERIGGECLAYDIPFFLEFVGYDDSLDEKGIEYARKKPAVVSGSMEEFSKPQYAVDVLKVEIPVNVAFVGGAKANKRGEAAYTREEALGHYRIAAAAATKPFIYLSAGVDDDVFRESLELAAEAGVTFAGVLCGRATWKEGIPVYATGGAPALSAWLADRGVKNIQALNETLLRGARPWHAVYGGMENIEVA